MLISSYLINGLILKNASSENSLPNLRVASDYYKNEIRNKTLLRTSYVYKLLIIQFTFTITHMRRLFSFSLQVIEWFKKSMNQFRKMFLCKTLIKEKRIVSPNVAVKVQVEELFWNSDSDVAKNRWKGCF